MKPRILILLGTKAQLIKMAPVLRLLVIQKIPHTLIFTGQHQETIPALQENFGLNDFDIVLYKGRDISKPWQFPQWFWETWRNAHKNKSLFLLNDPKQQFLLVHGDTFSTLLGALLGRLWGVKVAHIEAGLRSHNLLQPFPEEITRIVVGKLSHIHFHPGKWAGDNLAQYHQTVLINTHANTLVDTVKFSLEQQPRFQVPHQGYGLVSLHRFENLYNRQQLLRALKIIFLAAKKQQLLFMLHPATQHRLQKLGWLRFLQDHRHIQLIPRMNSTDFLHLVAQAEFVLTDGGSNQEECSYLGIPTLLLRKATERQEGLDKNVILSQLDEDVAKFFFENLDDFRSRPLSLTTSPSKIIVDWLKENYT